MLAIGCVLAALAAPAAVPGFAGAQAADDEYNLTLPGANGGGQNDAGTGGQAPGATAGDTGSGDGGGAPILLIALAGLAAACTGVAIWRLRDRPDGRPGKVGPGAPEAASETQ